MTERERRRVEHHGEAMTALQAADEFVVVTLNAEEDGTETPRIYATSVSLLPFFKDEVEAMYREGRRGREE